MIYVRKGVYKKEQMKMVCNLLFFLLLLALKELNVYKNSTNISNIYIYVKVI